MPITEDIDTCPNCGIQLEYIEKVQHYTTIDGTKGKRYIYIARCPKCGRVEV